MKSSVQKLEDSIEFTQGEDGTLKEQVKREIEQAFDRRRITEPKVKVAELE